MLFGVVGNFPGMERLGLSEGERATNDEGKGEDEKNE
ncbi:MAG: hypothetical protein ACJAVK_000257 [Akkermansiaceae bacterium]|jgi:hypothetical protein